MLHFYMAPLHYVQQHNIVFFTAAYVEIFYIAGQCGAPVRLNVADLKVDVFCFLFRHLQCKHTAAKWVADA
jgi:hypothetical protein